MADGARPVLDLSGPRLVRALEAVVRDSEPYGGVERVIEAIARKSEAFGETLADGGGARLDRERFAGLCAFMTPVRRHVGAWLTPEGFPAMRSRIEALLDGAADTSDAEAVDRRLAGFCMSFPSDAKHRWTRDLAAELLHATWPERYPLMTRWMWDRDVNSGVLREIWHAVDVDRIRIDVPDTYETFLVLREELAQFLADNGVFRDALRYVDLLCAQVYAEYICNQGGAFLRTDFATEMETGRFTYRMLGLDGIDPDTGRTRVKLADGGSFVVAAC